MAQNNTLYSSGRVAVLSTKLLGEEKFIRLAEANSLDSAVKILYENGYAGGAVLDNPLDFEVLLEKEMALIVDFFKKMLENDVVSDCFLLPYDYLNAKYLLKCHYSGGSVSPKLSSYGTLDSQIIAQAIDDGKYEQLPKPMAEAIQRVQEIGDKVSPYEIDTILTKAEYEDLFARAKKCGRVEIRRFYQVEIDTKNILGAFRCKKANFGYEQYEEMYLTNSTVSLQQVKLAFEKGFDKFAEEMKGTQYRNLVEVCMELAREDKPFTQAEILSANLKREEIVPHKNDMETVLPMVNYFLAKSTEIDNVRLVLVCKKNNIDEVLIKERLKESYV